MNRELLSACCRTSCEKDCFSFSLYFLQKTKYCLVVEVCIIVMHGNRIGTIIIFHINRNSLTKVCLEAVNTGIKQCFQLICIPFCCSRICKINQSHSRLPVINLFYSSSICTLYQVPFLHSFFEKCSSLCNIRIDPYADLQAFIFITFQHSRYIRENSLIPFKIAPVKFFHPEAVKVEYI